MKLSTIFRDVNSLLSTNNEWNEQLYSTDTINAINDAIRSQRFEYITNGMGYEFSETEMFYTSIEDFDYPFVRTAFELEKPLFRSLPIQQTILTSSFVKSDTPVKDEPQTFSKGDFVVKGSRLYEVVDDVDSQNVYDLTFKISQVRRPIKGATTKQGEVFFDGESYYKANEEYEFVGEEDLTNVASFDELFLRDAGGAYVDAMYVPFRCIHQLKLSESISDSYPFTIKDDVIYTSVDKTPFTITYIPEWQQVTDLNAELHIPDTMIGPVKQQAIQTLSIKFGMQPQTEQED